MSIKKTLRCQEFLEATIKKAVVINFSLLRSEIIQCILESRSCKEVARRPHFV